MDLIQNLALQSVTTRPNSTNLTEELEMHKLRTSVFTISERLRHTLRIEHCCRILGVRERLRHTLGIEHCCKILGVRESGVGDKRNKASGVDYYRKWRPSAWWSDCKSRVPKPGPDTLDRGVDTLSPGTVVIGLRCKKAFRSILPGILQVTR